MTAHTDGCGNSARTSDLRINPLGLNVPRIGPGCNASPNLTHKLKNDHNIIQTDNRPADMMGLKPALGRRSVGLSGGKAWVGNSSGVF